MSFSYKNLWNTLERYNMSKTDLRQTLGLSTATLAKLSSDQPVALDILDKICTELGCSLNDVITYESNTISTLPWSTISLDQTYLINFYFYHTKEQTAYIYGFATPYYITEEGMDQWTLSPTATNSDFYVLRGYIIGSQLFTLVQEAQNKSTIGQLLNTIGITLSLNHCTHETQNIICSLSVCNGDFIYRPKYLLATQEESLGHITQLKPQHSFEDDTMYCESLCGRNKQLLYSTEGISDTNKIQALWQLLKNELPIHDNINELTRINNFEIFSPLLPCTDAEEAIHWNIDCREESEKKVPEYISVYFNHHILQGTYSVNIRAYNTYNVFLDRMVQIHCGEEDIALRIPLQETLSRASVKVWHINNHNADANLVYSSTHSLIRHIHMDMHVINRTFQIEDDWTRKMEKKNIKVEKKGEYSSHHPVSIMDNSEEYWVSEEERVRTDAKLLLGTYHPLSEKGLFLSEGTENHLEFLIWFKKKLSNTDIHRVILIDPFITAESISQLLRSISNSNISYEVVTDAVAASHKDSTRIPNLKKMESFLDALQPGQLKIRAVSTSKVFLHDRFLILLGSNQIPMVYILSNSFDNVAEQHASVVMPTDNVLGRNVFDYYLKKFEEYDNIGQLELLYDSERNKKQTANTQTHAVSIDKKKYAPEDFIRQISADFSAALSLLAYMQPEDKRECIDYVMGMDSEKTISHLISILDGYLNCPNSNKPIRDTSFLLSTAQLLLKNTDSQGQLLQSVSLLFDYCYEYGRNHCGWDVYFAIQLLWEKAPALYCGQLTKLRQLLERDRSFADHRIFLLTASMVGHLATELAFNSTDSELSVLFQSDVPLLRALATAKVLSLPELDAIDSSLIDAQLRSIKEKLSFKELLWAELYQIKELQVLSCRKPRDYVRIQPLIDIIISHVVDDILSIAPNPSANGEFSDDDLYHYLIPLYTRNSEDICRIIKKLWTKGYYSNENAIKQLTSLFMEKYKKGFSNIDEYYREPDLQESYMILQYIAQIDLKSITKIKSELKKMEHKLQGRLYDAFLKTKNYRLWKSSIDLFCCLVLVELWIEQNYQLPASPAVKEFQRISQNFKPTLEKYSEVYQILIQNYPEME